MQGIDIIPELANHKIGQRYYDDANGGWDVGRAVHRYASKLSMVPPPGPGSAIEKFWTAAEQQMINWLKGETTFMSEVQKYNFRYPARKI